mmetsp:Transcript_2375/g.3044  ORF Transcript_2375/g.3044 Transcript_2375/m.3044 type:complete len:122 (+) Transcript_2375:193-558(+)|eukprot:CAMPEP_0204852192 /NCGR_PEP_ID=MMETSP1347-20130617/11365_1 /ASSEMBLY_ACC=CAM_ASM_000690 /TAXON_ID=215587 /ORGANISM="Aplanochytrium stocchinoi, Strain GSBS06" /LENGTH=121 /DNA_ID=CAMNT_0051996303 /DNA_START=92 /DNA_END=457 /DNA_ORIENTATION=-
MEQATALIISGGAGGVYSLALILNPTMYLDLDGHKFNDGTIGVTRCMGACILGLSVCSYLAAEKNNAEAMDVVCSGLLVTFLVGTINNFHRWVLSGKTSVGAAADTLLTAALGLLIFSSYV